MLNGLQMTEGERQMAKLREGLAGWVASGIGKGSESLKVSFYRQSINMTECNQVAQMI